MTAQECEFHEGLKLAAKMIEPFEGFRSRPYWDRYGRVWTIGYGETKGVGPHSKPVTRKQAEARLIRRLRRDFLPYVKQAVEDMPAGHRQLNRNRVAALLSLIYNTGPGAIMRGSTIGSALRRRAFEAASKGFMLWVRSGGVVLQGLVNRRRAEVRRFNRKV